MGVDLNKDGLCEDCEKPDTRHDIVLHADSHVDHGLPKSVIDAILKYRFEDGVHKHTFSVLGGCFEDRLIEETDDNPLVNVRWEPRPGRETRSRVCDNPLTKTSLVSFIVGPHDGLPTVLYTAFPGIIAPKEPTDLSITPEEMEESIKFWARYALSVAEAS